MEEKHIVTSDMVENFVKMIQSSDSGDGILALEILDNRDKTNQESEDNFDKITNSMMSDSTLFPRTNGNEYVIKMKGKVMIMNSGSLVFDSERGAKMSLNRHFSYHFERVERHINYLKSLDPNDPNYQRNITWYKVTPFEHTIISVFKDHKALLKFLLDNKIIEIVPLNS